MKIANRAFLSLSLAVLFHSACTGDYKRKENKVVVHFRSNPETLNAANYSDQYSGIVAQHIFQSLTNIDFKTLEFLPVLAESLPEVKTQPDGRVHVTYHIRKEAEWDNGSPVSANDVIFSLKAIKNPRTNADAQRTVYERIHDVIVYPDNPRKLTVVLDTVFFLTSISGDFFVMPEYIYDPDGLMKKFSIRGLNSDSTLKNDPSIIKFAEDFNSEKRMREAGFVSGSAAYRFAEWKTGEQLVLERKKDWWGDKIKGINCYFDAYPDKIVYKIINDPTTAVTSLKAGVIDIIYEIPPKDFVDLMNSPDFKSKYHLYTPTQFSYRILGVNTKSPLLTDKKTRQALAHLVNKEQIIKTVMYGLGVPVSGPIHPLKKKEYHDGIVPYDYNPEKAKKLLEEAGWKNANNDKTLDKVAGGKRTEFVVDLMYTAGSEVAKQTAIIFKDEAAKVGIDVNIQAREWNDFLERCASHKFDLRLGGWVSTPLPFDLKQIYHTQSALGGSNYESFGNPVSDSLIDAIRTEMDADKRFPMYKKLQEIMHDEVAHIFILAPVSTIAMSKKFINAEAYTMRPGFWEAGLKTEDDQ